MTAGAWRSYGRGFRDGADPFAEIRLNDFYDPDGAKGIKALFVTLGWNGCPAALTQAGRTETWDTKGSSTRRP
jgi:hypothetical protein